jgi:outer membrane immunogenic protein
MRIIKILFCIILLGLLSPTLLAQYALPKGKAQFNAGFGLSSWGLPIYLGLDYGVHKDVSIGGEVSYRAYNEKWKHRGNQYNFRRTVLGIAFNANYHFNSLLDIDPEWDFYAGLNLGFYSWSDPDPSNNYVYDGRYNSGLGLGGQLGARYYFSRKAAINLEVGSGNAFTGGKLGITLKL